jgi:hypothetical protein
VLGRQLRVCGAGRAAEVAARLRERWDFPEYAESAADVPYTITVHVRDSVPQHSDAGSATVHTATPEGSLAWRVVDRSTWQLVAPANTVGLRLALGTGGSVVELWWSAPGAEEGALLATALHLAITESLRASGLLPFHGGAIVRDDGVTLLLGASGVGKSTTVARALAAGWAAVAEDMAWLDPQALRVYGWDRGLRLGPASREQFAPALAPGAWRPDPDGKERLDYAALGPAAVRSGPLARIAVLARGGGDGCNSAWEPIAPRDVVRALWEGTGVPLAGPARSAVARVIPTLIARVPCARLRLGDGPLPL